MRLTGTGIVVLLGGFLAFFATSAAGSLPATPKSSTNTVALDSVRSGGCSKAEATAVVKRIGWSDASGTYPVYKVLCGAFTGAGSQIMVASIYGSDNAGMIYWVVFRWSGSDWQLVIKQHQAAILTAAGSDIREAVPIYRVGDPRCCPSGGTRARIWHWVGSRFTAGPWKRVTPGTAAAPRDSFKDGFFKTLSGNIVCYHYVGSGASSGATVACGIKSGLKPAPPRRPCEDGGYAGDRVYLDATSRVSAPSCAGDPGALVGESRARVLAYGETWSGGGIRCTSAVTGLTCRNKSGHGFFLSRERWRRF